MNDKSKEKLEILYKELSNNEFDPVTSIYTFNIMTAILAHINHHIRKIYPMGEPIEIITKGDTVKITVPLKMGSVMIKALTEE